MKIIAEKARIDDIADAVRRKLNVETQYRLSEIPAAIDNIYVGGELEPLSATANGDYTPGTGIEGFSRVHVAVPGPTLVTKNIVSNGTYNASSDNADGYSSVTVAVPGGVTVEPLEVTENGTYNPPSGVDGYAPVTVNVSGGGISGVYKGTGAPSSSLGSDGDIYIREYPLPNNVNFVEYLQSDGNAYIDTGIIADENTGAYAKFEVTGGHTAFCARYSASSRTYGIICVDGGATLSLDMDTVRTQSPTAIGNVVEAKMNRFIKEKNGTTIGITNPASFTTPANVTLFAINATNSYGLVVSPSKIHRVVFTQNGVVTHDFLPALDGNGVACMYESISGNYYYNAAVSGSFLYGNTATPSETEPTIYRKANGTWQVITQIGLL